MNVSTLHQPAHENPLPEYPFLQVHVNDPGLSTQLAFTSQVCLLVVHSLMSEMYLKNENIIRQT